MVFVWSYLRNGFLVLNLAGSQKPEHIFGPLSNSMLHPVVMPQFFNTQLHPAQILVTFNGGVDKQHYWGLKISYNAAEVAITKDTVLTMPEPFIQLKGEAAFDAKNTVVCFGSVMLKGTPWPH